MRHKKKTYSMFGGIKFKPARGRELGAPYEIVGKLFLSCFNQEILEDEDLIPFKYIANRPSAILHIDDYTDNNEEYIDSITTARTSAGPPKIFAKAPFDYVIFREDSPNVKEITEMLRKFFVEDYDGVVGTYVRFIRENLAQFRDQIILVDAKSRDEGSKDPFEASDKMKEIMLENSFYGLVIGFQNKNDGDFEDLESITLKKFFRNPEKYVSQLIMTGYKTEANSSSRGPARKLIPIEISFSSVAPTLAGSQEEESPLRELIGNLSEITDIDRKIEDAQKPTRSIVKGPKEGPTELTQEQIEEQERRRQVKLAQQAEDARRAAEKKERDTAKLRAKRAEQYRRAREYALQQATQTQTRLREEAKERNYRKLTPPEQKQHDIEQQKTAAILAELGTQPTELSPEETAKQIKAKEARIKLARDEAERVKLDREKSAEIKAKIKALAEEKEADFKLKFNKLQATVNDIEKKLIAYNKIRTNEDRIKFIDDNQDVLDQLENFTSPEKQAFWNQTLADKQASKKQTYDRLKRQLETNPKAQDLIKILTSKDVIKQQIQDLEDLKKKKEEDQKEYDEKKTEIEQFNNMVSIFNMRLVSSIPKEKLPKPLDENTLRPLTFKEKLKLKKQIQSNYVTKLTEKRNRIIESLKVLSKTNPQVKVLGEIILKSPMTGLIAIVPTEIMEMSDETYRTKIAEEEAAQAALAARASQAMDAIIQGPPTNPDVDTSDKRLDIFRDQFGGLNPQLSWKDKLVMGIAKTFFMWVINGVFPHTILNQTSKDAKKDLKKFELLGKSVFDSSKSLETRQQDIKRIEKSYNILPFISREDFISDDMNNINIDEIKQMATWYAATRVATFALDLSENIDPNPIPALETPITNDEVSGMLDEFQDSIAELLESLSSEAKTRSGRRAVESINADFTNEIIKIHEKYIDGDEFNQRLRANLDLRQIKKYLYVEPKLPISVFMTDVFEPLQIADTPVATPVATPAVETDEQQHQQQQQQQIAPSLKSFILGLKPQAEESSSLASASVAPTSSARGKGKSSWALHKVYIKKPMSFDDAYKLAHEFIKDKNKIFVKEYPNKFNFRNIPKQKFNKFRGKIINDDITLVYGELKPEYSSLAGSGKPPPFMGDDMSAGQMRFREDFEYLRPLFSLQDKMSPHEFDSVLSHNRPRPYDKFFLTKPEEKSGTYYEKLTEQFRN